MNFKIRMDGLDVEVRKLDIQQNYTIGVSNIFQVPGNRSIKMIGIISNQAYMKLDTWFNGILGRNYVASSPASYKKNVIFNTIQIMGILFLLII